MATTQMDQDIDLDLDDPAPCRASLLHHAARAALALSLVGVLAAAGGGHLDLESKTLPAVFALVAILAACVLATRPTRN